MRRLALPAVIFLSLFAFSCPADTEDNHERERTFMVEHDLKGRDITDKDVLHAMSKVPRHLFVPPHLSQKAYVDSPLPIGEGQTISQPYVVALMTQAVSPKPGDIALEIGTGSGYQAAVLSEIVREVYTIEIIPELAEKSSKKLMELGYKNVFVKTGDGFFGWPEHAPFDLIIVTAAAERVPEKLIEQLKKGGRLIMPVGPEKELQRLTLLTKQSDGTLMYLTREGVRFVPMTGEIQRKMRIKN